MGYKSLESTVEQLQPCYTKDVILAARNTPSASRRVWIVVEGSDDIKIYEKFFNPDRTKVLPSTTSTGRRGCACLEQIVTELLAVDATILVLGIRDRDYTQFQNPPYTFPPSVFVTDYRDIEMTMLATRSVISALARWNRGFVTALRRCRPVARHIGHMRICNDLYSLGCNFKKMIKVSQVWDQGNQEFVSNWQYLLLQLFCSSCKRSFSQQDFDTVKSLYDLDKKHDLFICQGHDMLRLLPSVMPQNDRIRERIVDAYSQKDFCRSQLYSDISAWANGHHVQNLWA